MMLARPGVASLSWAATTGNGCRRPVGLDGESPEIVLKRLSCSHFSEFCQKLQFQRKYLPKSTI
jgi:hypothetical protein